MTEGAPGDRGRASTLARRGPVFAALVGLTLLAILLQGVFAGEFIDRVSRHHGWLNAHDTGADVTLALAVISAAYAVVTLRDAARSLVIGSVVLALLLIAQVAIGHAVTGSGDDWLLAIHVPLALLAFGLGIWLSVKARELRKAAARR